MKKVSAKIVAFTALMAALANVLSIAPLAIPLPLAGFTSSIHFSQLAIFLGGIIAGPWGGLISGAVGGIYMGVTKIPFVVGGLALLGVSVGLLSRRMRPLFACLLAWVVQAPYVLVTDYVWFTSFVKMPSAAALGVIAPIMLTLTLEAIASAILADVIMHYVKKAGITF
jgi:uncharacterized membrane protein